MSEQPDLNWYDVSEHEHGVVAIAEPGHIEDVKAYLVISKEQSLLVDSGLGFANVLPVIRQYTRTPILLVNTHGHLDHIGNNWRFERVWVHQADSDRVRAGVSNQALGRFLKPDAFYRNPPSGFEPGTYYTPGVEPERTIDEDDIVDLGDRQLRVIHVPGHTPGCIALYEEATGTLISGDMVHEGGLYAHYPGGSAHEYRDSLRKLAALAPDLSIVHPSHYRYPLEPVVVTNVHNAMESIWNGRAPDETDDKFERFLFERFSFTFRVGWQFEAQSH